MTAASPARTTVLAVGLERYAYGPGMNLDGAADYARRFTAWAHGRDVPAGRIYLACSPETAVEPLDELVEPAADGVQLVGTTRAELDAALHQVMADGGDLLLL